MHVITDIYLVLVVEWGNSYDSVPRTVRFGLKTTRFAVRVDYTVVSANICKEISAIMLLIQRIVYEKSKLKFFFRFCHPCSRTCMRFYIVL